KIVVVDSKVNRRQGGARNLGIRQARGEFLGFVDADDFVHKDMYATLLEKMRESPADFACIRGVRVPEDATPLNLNLASLNPDEFLVWPDELWEINNKTLSDDGREKLMVYPVGGAGFRLYRKDFILQKQLFFPENVLYEDNYWGTLVCSCVEKFLLIDQVMYYYRYNPNSTTNHNGDGHLDRIWIEEHLNEEMERNGDAVKYHDALEYICATRYYRNTFYHLIYHVTPMRWDVVQHIKKYVQRKYPNFRHNRYLLKLSEAEYKKLLYMFDHPYLWRLRVKLKLEGGFSYLVWKLKVETNYRFPRLYRGLKKLLRRG
ncbi:MAG: glycosyltransferase, partial [Fretibacterium sp.]|nr:glycosyltransferase [Fretibacterium sp.]